MLMTVMNGVDRIASDLLFGASAVAGETGLTRRQVYHAAEYGHMPLFKIGGTICARRSTLVKWFAEKEAGNYPPTDKSAEDGP